jgi:hypothetical protein
MTIYNFWWQYYGLFHLKTNPWFDQIINLPGRLQYDFFSRFISAMELFLFPFRHYSGPLAQFRDFSTGSASYPLPSPDSWASCSSRNYPEAKSQA